MDVDSAPRTNRFRVLWTRLKEHPLSKLGPGLITGVADDDPSGIATYSQAGAQFGLNMLWTMPLTFPLMAAVQSMCANLGRVTGKGLAANIKTAFPPIVLQSVVLLLLIANTLNIAADVAAMGEVAELVSGVDRHLMTAVFVFGTLALQMFVPYHRYVFYLKWLTLSLLAYAACCLPCTSRGSRSPCVPSGPLHPGRDRCRGGRRGVRHNHQPLSVFLADL
ncbi:divalent metal cation transporter [Pseudomonas sp. PCH446]